MKYQPQKERTHSRDFVLLFIWLRLKIEHSFVTVNATNKAQRFQLCEQQEQLNVPHEFLQAPNKTPNTVFQ